MALGKKGTREMNANDLADEVMEHYRASLPRGFNVNWMEETATMLRKQQAEIEDLKAKLQLHDAMDNQCASLMQQFRKVHEK